VAVEVIAKDGHGTEVAAWLAQRRDDLHARLLERGALLFRGFDVTSARRLEAFARELSTEVPQFDEESSPRSPLGGDVYTSTDYPPDWPIQFHNEYSYGDSWPLRLFFCCLEPPEHGGQTPLADSRSVLQRISAATREAFAERGVLYTRNFIPGMGVSWENAFRASDRDHVERRCNELGIRCEWLEGGRLRTTQVADAIVRHPVCGEAVWFNHAFFFNANAIEPLALREVLLKQREEDFPTHTRFGDGSPISAETVEELRAAYAAECVQFDWQTGDVLWIDNMLMSHSRRPFSGKRRIATIMTDRVTRSSLAGGGRATHGG
jgi:alpha-ketoglutarate-dependent taurine dioxygenase